MLSENLRLIALPVALGLVLAGAGCSDDGGGDDGGNEAASFCTEAQEAMAEVGGEVDLEGLGAAWREMDAEVPESIADDWDLVLERWEELAEAPAEAETDPSAPEEAEAEADRGLELQLAWRSVRSYFRDLCDMDLP